MLKLEKIEYLNSIFQLNNTRYEKTLQYKLVNYIKIHKFESQHFFIRRIFFFLIKKNTIENQKFNFLTIICEIQKNVSLKNCFEKLFVSVRSTNYV